MKRLLSCLLLIVAVSACNAAATASQPSSGFSPAANGGVPSPTVDPRTSTAPAPSPTDTLIPTAASTPSVTVTSTSVPCDPSGQFCIEGGHFFLDRPIALPGTITVDRGYLYGTTENGTREPHHGVEFNNASGTPVMAAADGLVVVAGNDSQTIYAIYPNSYGNIIVLEHHFPGIDQPVFTVYGHLSKVEVQAGQIVRTGDEIGKVGATGAAIGSHLHFEVRLGQDNYDSNRNPILWLKPLTGGDGNSMGVLAGRLEDAHGNNIYTTSMDIQYFPDPNGPQASAWQTETYAPEQHPVNGDNAWNENFALGDIPAGIYRISLIWGSRLYEHWISVYPGKLTFFLFRVD